MTSLATDAKNDLFLTPEGSIALARGVFGVMQDCEHAMKAQLGELVLNLPRGVPTLATIWQQWNPVQFEAYARRMLLSVPNVKAVTNFAVTRAGDVATYTATIQVDLAALTLQAQDTGGFVPGGDLLTEEGFTITTESGIPIGLG